MRQATARVKEQRSDCDVLAWETRQSEQSSRSRVSCDPMALIGRSRLEALGSVSAPAASVASMSQMERAKDEAANASARTLQAQLDDATRAEQIVSALGDILPDARVRRWSVSSVTSRRNGRFSINPFGRRVIRFRNAPMPAEACGAEKTLEPTGARSRPRHRSCQKQTGRLRA